MNKIVLTLAQKQGYSLMLMGIGAIIYSAMFLLGGEIYDLIGSILQVVCSLGGLTILLMKGEAQDERAYKNSMEAGFNAFISLIIALNVASIFAIYIDNFAPDYKSIFRIFIGLAYFIYGFFFVRYEKEGY